jgi:fucose permease
MDGYLTTLQTLGLLVGGMCYALLGSIKVPLAKQLDIEEGKVGGLISAFGFTMIPMAFAAGFLADAIGREVVLAAACGILIASVLVLANVNSYFVAVISVLLLGTGWSALVNVLNALQGPAFLPFFGAGAPLSTAMNMGDFIFGIGAFAMPIATAMMLARVGLRKTFSSFSVLIVVTLGFVFLVNWEPLTPVKVAAQDASFGRLVSDTTVLLCCLAFFFHVPMEACVGVWATTLMKDQGVSDGRSSSLLSVFWMAFTLSRLVAALTMVAGTDHVILMVLSGACAGLTLGLAASKSKEMTSGFIILAGAVMGPIFPILIALLITHVQSDLSEQLVGRAIGLFFCIGGIGWAVVPLLVGKIAQKTSVQKAFFVVAGAAACLTAVAVVLNFV